MPTELPQRKCGAAAHVFRNIKSTEYGQIGALPCSFDATQSEHTATLDRHRFPEGYFLTIEIDTHLRAG